MYKEYKHFAMLFTIIFNKNSIELDSVNFSKCPFFDRCHLKYNAIMLNILYRYLLLP